MTFSKKTLSTPRVSSYTRPDKRLTPPLRARRRIADVSTIYIILKSGIMTKKFRARSFNEKRNDSQLYLKYKKKLKLFGEFLRKKFKKSAVQSITH
ncbi:hypothetical protein BpHYR1_021591 [Brachionus plicatilis]|uniref:Uncharacterized protein n=1 Tax=Brachionus plicatilis TaxID=10195 RepID=A0A3M7RE06_BRAPC|nr:hypothetical protein BpHYR1_021591 [Brachionus plicatilis]